ncbi:NADH dehydrogenase [Phthorimaea operculella]|nr:NADH dehydrogenase [Phthorimaea operculella]
MVITKDLKLPSCEELKVKEVNLSSAHLMAAAPYLGKYCEAVNNEFMLCRKENGDNPIPCVPCGKLVTKCTLEFFRKVKNSCRHEHDQYANCIDKSSGNYQPWHCRKTQAVYEECIDTQLGIKNPGFGYFTRGRIHTTNAPEPSTVRRACKPKDPETPSLPDDKERLPARFGSRNYWQTE